MAIAARNRLANGDVASSVIVATAAIFGAQQPQTAMEQWLGAKVRDRLASHDCLRVALVGHSHGGVTVTTIGAALEQEFPGRLLIIPVDRTAALYDRHYAVYRKLYFDLKDRFAEIAALVG